MYDGPKNKTPIENVQLIPAYVERSQLIPLYEEYAKLLLETEPIFQVSLDQQNYTEEIGHLEEKYGFPKGRIYLVYVNDDLAGCVGMKPLDEEHAELKRLYRRMGFREIDAYYDCPVPGTIFMEIDL